MSQSTSHQGAWQGLTPVSVLPPVAAEAAPEPDAPQGEYNPRAPEAPLSVPLVERAGPARPAELLAPAGGFDAACAAFHYGADAIYLGLKKFSARAEAENFSLEEVDAITAFAHSLAPRRRVFVTVNTLILQHELREALDALAALEDIGVDAAIVQDLGVYALVRKHFPGLELHGSTQMSVHNRAGAEALRKLGFARVVLARELTFEEVREITASGGVETEVFVHGALCYSYSGLCLFSSQLVGRSGNRGKCAYTCRDSYTIEGAPEILRDGAPTKRDPSSGFPFSMKDLALPDHLPALKAAGVSCFKIEGRKKSPLYVATTTDYYRGLLDEKIAPEARAAREADLQTVFSRPWTRLFVQSHRDKEVADRDTVGHRGAPVGKVERVVNADGAAWLRFRTRRKLERHDGLQIDLPTLGRPFGFALEELRLPEAREGPASRGRRPRAEPERTYEAPSGSLVEIRLPEDHPPLPEGATVYCASSQEVKRRFGFARPNAAKFFARRGVRIEVELAREALRAALRVPARHAREAEIAARAELAGPFEPARDAAGTEKAVRAAFEKLGETRFELADLKLLNPDGLFVPASRLNALRRDLCAAAEAELQAQARSGLERIWAEVAPPAAATAGTAKPGAFRWSIKVDRAAALGALEAPDLDGLDEAVVDIARDGLGALEEQLARLEPRIGRERIRLALPALTRKWEERQLLHKLERLRAAGWTRWEVANLSGWTYLGLEPAEASVRAAGLDLATDWSIYVINRIAARQVLELGATRFACSPEDGLANLRSLLPEFPDQATVIVHQDTPLFLAESCAYANLIGGCPGKANCRFEQMALTSSYNERFLALDYHCRTIVLGEGAYCLAPRLADLAAAGARRLRAEFIYRQYEPEEVRARWRLIRKGRNVPQGHCANFDRGLL
ncbi:MAG: U32 family peptidase [Planctomycetota bacterium]|nr:U32 family peptidase [Planctomycetota bacterium]